MTCLHNPDGKASNGKGGVRSPSRDVDLCDVPKAGDRVLVDCYADHDRVQAFGRSVCTYGVRAAFIIRVIWKYEKIKRLRTRRAGPTSSPQVRLAD